MPPEEQSQSQETINALMRKDLQFIKDAISGMRQEITDWKKAYVTKEEFKPVADNYVSQDEFWPVKTIAYGLVSLALTTLIIAILFTVISGSHPTITL